MRTIAHIHCETRRSKDETRDTTAGCRLRGTKRCGAVRWGWLAILVCCAAQLPAQDFTFGTVTRTVADMTAWDTVDGVGAWADARRTSGPVSTCAYSDSAAAETSFVGIDPITQTLEISAIGRTYALARETGTCVESFGASSFTHGYVEFYANQPGFYRLHAEVGPPLGVAGGWYDARILFNGSAATFGNSPSDWTGSLSTGRYVVEWVFYPSVGVQLFNGITDEFASTDYKFTFLANPVVIPELNVGGTSLLPAIINHPQSQTASQGTSITFSALAFGSSPMTYQWRHNGNAMTDATNASLALPDVGQNDQGNYDVTVSNPLGSVTSSNATLTVTPPEPSYDNSLWIGTDNTSNLQALNVDRFGNLLRSLPPGEVTGMAIDPAGNRLFLGGSSGGITPYDLSTLTAGAMIPAATGYLSEDMAFDGANLWRVRADNWTLYRIRPDDGVILWSNTLTFGPPIGIAWDGTGLWISAQLSGTVARYDSNGNPTGQQFSTGLDGTGGLAYDTTDGTLWIGTFGKVFHYTTNGVSLGWFSIPAGDNRFIDGLEFQGATPQIQKAVPVITWNPGNITYPAPLGAWSLNAVSSVPGTFVYNPPAGTVLATGTHELTATFTPADTDHYQAVEVTASIAVDPGYPVLTWPDPQDIAYGTVLGSAQLNASASVAGTFTYTPAAGTILNAGNYQQLRVDFVPDDTNYLANSRLAHINVLKASPIITWPRPADIYVGTSLSSAQLNASANVSGTFSYEPDFGTTLFAGWRQPLVAGFLPSQSGNYETVSVTNSIDVLQPAPHFDLQWGSLGTGPGQFQSPSGIAADSHGNVYVTDQFGDRVQKFSSAGVFLTMWGSHGSAPGQFYQPDGIAIGTGDLVFVADYANHRLQQFDSAGNFLRVIGSQGNGPSQFFYPAGLATDQAGNVYVADAGNNRVQKLNAAGDFVGGWGTYGSGPGQFITPLGVAVDGNSRVYVADFNNRRVQVFDANGGYVTSWGPAPAGDETFQGLTGIAADTANHVYLARAVNAKRLEMFDDTGALLTRWGDPGFGLGEVTGAHGIAADTFGNIYVADLSGHRVQRFSYFYTPTIGSLAPAGAVAGAAAFTLSIQGSHFAAEAQLLWNGTPRAATVISPNEIQVAISAAELETASQITAISVQILNPGNRLSNPMVFTITGPGVSALQSTAAAPGQTVSTSTAPAGDGESGVAATVTNSGGDVVTLSTATYSDNPAAGAMFTVGGAFVDLQITGADSNDSATAQFYYPDTIAGATEAALQLVYFNSTDWVPVLSSGSVAPTKSTTDNLDSTISGGRFSVVFDDTSTPRITELSGTIFAAANPQPIILAASGPIEPTQVNSAVTASMSFLALGDPAAQTVTIDWGDGNTSIALPAAAGSAQGAHAYAAPGVYTIGFIVRDEFGNTAETDYRYAVIYDPSAGFVTGGGWIMSPPGAYVADPTLEGKATFGFVSRYQKGANVPTGNTQFHFQAGDFRFQSTAYDWLVVSGAKGQYKGSGKINGTGDYGFLLTATDGQLAGGGSADRFRIKIWDKPTSTVVYDNLMGQADDADPSTIAGGSIVIHK